MHYFLSSKYNKLYILLRNSLQNENKIPYLVSLFLYF